MRYRRPIVFKNYVSTSYVEDSQGRKTGQRAVVYGDAITVYGTVSTPTGSTSLEMFGTDKDYDKYVVLDMTSITVTENSIFWIDVQYGENVPHDYVVRKVLKNHNFLTIGLRKVDVKNGGTNSNQAQS